MVRKVTYRYNSKERKLSSLLPFELTIKGMSWKEIMKKYNLSHTETGRILKLLLLNESIIVKDKRYFINPSMPPYWHELTFPNIFRENDSKIINSYKLEEIFSSNYIHIYGVDKRDLSLTELKEVEKVTKHILEGVTRLKKIVSSNRQKIYAPLLESLIKPKSYSPKVRKFILLHKKEILKEMVSSLNFEWKEILRFREETKQFPFNKKSFFLLNKNNQGELFMILTYLQSELSKFRTSINEIKIINDC